MITPKIINIISDYEITQLPFKEFMNKYNIYYDDASLSNLYSQFYNKTESIKELCKKHNLNDLEFTLLMTKLYDDVQLIFNEALIKNKADDARENKSMSQQISYTYQPPMSNDQRESEMHGQYRHIHQTIDSYS